MRDIAMSEYPPSGEQIEEAAELLRRGHLVAFPTETVYGLGADGLNKQAIERVYWVKGRPSNNPLIMHVTGLDMAAPLVDRSGEIGARAWHRARKLTSELWPGALTIVLPRGDNVPDSVVGGPQAQTVAIRCPQHPVALALLFSFGGPLVGPSANKSGMISPTAATHVRQSFSVDDVYVLDGGPCQIGLESTVINLAAERPCIIRPGVLSAEQLADVLGEMVDVLASATHGPADGTLISPGLLGSHYAPSSPCQQFGDWDDLESLIVQQRGRSQTEDSSASNPIVLVLSHSVTADANELAVLGGQLNLRIELVSMPPSASEYARTLYSTLRLADDRQPMLIAVHQPPHGSVARADGDFTSAAIWDAIADRLRRAAQPHLRS
jgi:L-threonylcarbamoyladenylate synthase